MNVPISYFDNYRLTQLKSKWIDGITNIIQFTLNRETHTYVIAPSMDNHIHMSKLDYEIFKARCNHPCMTMEEKLKLFDSVNLIHYINSRVKAIHQIKWNKVKTLKHIWTSRENGRLIFTENDIIHTYLISSVHNYKIQI